MAIALTLGVALAACFDPTRPEILNCSTHGLCPGSMVCQADNVCRDIAADGSDARPFAVDAAPDIDAVPVACNSSSDCEMPPDLCYMPGTCDIDTKLCVFPKVACNANETCATHQCNPSTGQCETTATNEAATCAPQNCTDYGPCGFDDMNTCDETGMQTRSCTDSVCVSGACVGTSNIEPMACSRVTTGDDCNGGTTCGLFSACSYTDGQCDELGNSTRSCTDRTCASGSCISTERVENKACSRMTDNQSCDFQSCPGPGQGFQEICCSSGLCNQPCGPCEPFI
jgi:hypothetical protein